MPICGCGRDGSFGGRRRASPSLYWQWEQFCCITTAASFRRKITLYEGFYKLRENPFRLTPDPSFVYMTVQHQEALSGLIYSACTRPGLTVLTGEPGTGKTTLLYALLGLLEKRRAATATS